MGNGDEGKKKYTVVDRRFDLDDDEAQAAAAEAERAEQAEGREEASAPEVQEQIGSGPEAEEAYEGEDEIPGGAPDLHMSDAMRMVLSMIRERVFMSLGLVISKRRPTGGDMDEVSKLTSLFGSLVDANMDKLGPDELGEGDGGKIPSPGELLEFCFNVMQSRILVRMGLIADPATGLIARDLAQARQGIDFCASMVQNATGLIDPEQQRRLEAVVSDLRINYVNILKQA